MASGMQFLYLFSGPEVVGSVRNAVGELGGSMDCYDIRIDKHHDLCDDALWCQILAELQKEKYQV